MADALQIAATDRTAAPGSGSAGPGVAPAARAHWHAGVWFAWAFAAAASVELAPSPVYAALVVAVAALAVGAHARRGAYARAFPVLVLLGATFAIVRMLLTAATTHGLGTVLFTTPHLVLPRALGGFTIGGTIELQVVLQSLAEGFVIVGVMAAFGAFNSVVAHAELVESTPRAFYEIGLIVVVALAFVPSTLVAVQEVRDADRARTGARVVRPGRLLRRLVPVLELGLERAVTLAESMDARGFARDHASRSELVVGWWSLGALLALGGAFVALIGRATAVAVGLAALGIVGVIGATCFASRAARRPRYRPRRMRTADWLAALAALGAPALLAVTSLAGEASLTWAASPLHWPSLHLLPMLALGPLLLPVVVAAPADST